MTRLLLIAAVSISIIGCGSKSEPRKEALPTELTITLPDGSSEKLTCPSADKRCSNIDIAAFAALPEDRVCAQVYGGPETALIVGRVNNQPVNLRLSRTDSCKIAQWDRLAWLVGPAKQTATPLPR